MIVNVYIGDNATGKTKILYQMMQNLEDSAYSTNMLQNKSYVNLGYDEKIVNSICNSVGCEPMFTKNTGIIFSSEFSKELNYILTLLSINVKIILLDEPEWNMSREEVCIMLEAINSMRDSDKQIFITTHDVGLTTIMGARLYLVKAGIPRSVKRSDIFGKMDTIRG